MSASTTRVAAQQMFGGHGYIAEWGMEQFVRDARIAMIYEGANGIQALDLVGRKLPKDGGRAVMAFFNEVGDFAEGAGRARRWRRTPGRSARVCRTCSRRRCGSCRTPWRGPIMRAPAPPTTCTSSACVALGYMWARMAKAAHPRKAADGAAATDAQLLAGRFFMERMMPDTAVRLARITAGADTMMSIPPMMF